jgi:hypothetical protein
MLDEPSGCLLVQADIFGLLLGSSLRELDLLEILLHPGELLEDGVRSGFNAIEAEIGWTRDKSVLAHGRQLLT